MIEYIDNGPTMGYLILFILVTGGAIAFRKEIMEKIWKIVEIVNVKHIVQRLAQIAIVKNVIARLAKKKDPIIK